MHTVPTPSAPSRVLANQDILGMVLTVKVAVLPGGIGGNILTRLMLRKTGKSNERQAATMAGRVLIRTSLQESILSR